MKIPLTFLYQFSGFADCPNLMEIISSNYSYWEAEKEKEDKEPAEDKEDDEKGGQNEETIEEAIDETQEDIEEKENSWSLE